MEEGTTVMVLAHEGGLPPFELTADTLTGLATNFFPFGPTIAAL